MKRGILAVLAALSFAAAGCATLYGAAAGASIGALAGDAGKGAAIGASVGAVIDIID
jgi:predicted small secreted protein